MKHLNLDYLEAFVVVMECGTFSAAAERLQLTQPAVSLQVRQLEKNLAATLVERVGRKAKPTAAGAELLAHAPQISAAVSSAVEAVGRQTKEGIARVRLGTGATACIFLLPPILKDLRRKYPGLEITVTTGNTEQMAKALEENTVDVALVTMPISGRMFEITPIMEDELVLIAPSDMPFPARITPAALSGKPVVLYEPIGKTRHIVDRWFARGGVLLKPAMSLGSVEAIKEMVGVGLGCAVVPRMALGDKRRQVNMAVRSLSPTLYRQLAVVIRQDKRLNLGIRAILSALKAMSVKVHG
jgi:DNA-binding transcriptional LysR family regulator